MVKSGEQLMTGGTTSRTMTLNEQLDYDSKRSKSSVHEQREICPNKKQLTITPNGYNYAESTQAEIVMTRL
jgi:hypothetical protein